MKRRFVMTAFTASVMLSAALAQDGQRIERFYFEGYRVVFVPSTVFKVKVAHPEMGRQETKGNSFALTIKEPNGRMPKDTVWVYTNALRNISLNFSTIEMQQPLTVDTLQVSATSSHGTVWVNAKKMEVSAKAGSHLVVKGKAHKLVCKTVGNGNSIDHNDLIEE
ncbi:MAG: GIN domain-containing protein [Tannerella sp.]|uniref:GIN domain-containing protein n=1 Tax=Tannerella sp. TaxID=2382127 RepID=UPI003FA220F5